MSHSDSRRILFVLGMHRSGTSALCAALQACGASFGERLLDPMDGVNDEGFWEDADVVDINESLLRQGGSEWYACAARPLTLNWAEPAFDQPREQAVAVLERGFGKGPVEVVKDPRLCLTLPFWTELCAEQGISTSVCVTNRAPMEVARSLQKRDGFPLGYGLRLHHTYQQGIALHAPDDAVYVTYDQLLADPADCMKRLAELLPLDVSRDGLGSVVRADLRHHHDTRESGPLYEADAGAGDPEALEKAIEQFSPIERTVEDLVASLVGRGAELTRIGSAHSAALATLDERDADIEKLSREHRHALGVISERDAELEGIAKHLTSALETIDERDKQIAEFDRRLCKLGEEHSYALNLIQSRDEQLQRVFDKPGIGLLFKAMWKHEQR